MNASEPSTSAPRDYWLLPRGMGIIYCAVAVSMFLGDWWPILFGAKKAGISDFIFPFLYLLITGVFLVPAFRNFVRLSEDSIEIHRLWGTQVLPFNKIKGRRRYTEKADPYSTPAQHLVLEPNDDRFPRIDIKIKDSYRFDESFYRWFDSLPNLDKLDGLDAPQSKYSNFSLV